MRKLLFIFCCSLFLLISCKKETNKCEGVVCQTGNTCVNGVCQDTCAANKHNEKGDCVCDTGWIGGNCSCMIDSFVGTYYVEGNYTDTLEVIKHNNALLVNGAADLYTYKSSTDTAAYCRFSWYGNVMNNSEVRFRKSMDDSIFFFKMSGSIMGGSSIYLSGRKIN